MPHGDGHDDGSLFYYGYVAASHGGVSQGPNAKGAGKPGRRSGPESGTRRPEPDLRPCRARLAGSLWVKKRRARTQDLPAKGSTGSSTVEINEHDGPGRACVAGSSGVLFGPLATASTLRDAPRHGRRSYARNPA